MNWKLAGVVLEISLAVSAMAQSLVPIPITMSGPSPWIDVRAYGAVGDGSTDDQPAIQAAISACPTNGCTVYFPSAGASGTRYKIFSGLSINTKGVKLVGECGSIGTATLQTCSHLVSDQSIVMLKVGTAGTSIFDSGLVIQDLGFQDISSMSNMVIGAIRVLQTDDFVFNNVHCQDITQGYCFLFDGNNGNNTYNFTQFGVVNGPFIINVKYPVQINPEASEINFFGGNINCNNNTGTTIGMDLGKTKGSAGLLSGGEFGIFGTHIYNCAVGISMWNFSNLNYYGIMEQTSGGYHGTGIVIDGDVSGKPSKSIIAGSMDEFVKGVVLQGTAPPQFTRIFANISNIDPINGAAIVASGTALSTAAIVTPVNYVAAGGSGGVSIGSQLPDLTMPEETQPAAVASSRRIYVDSNNADHLSSERSDGSVADLETNVLYYQPAGAALTSSGTLYSFSVPPIPDGGGIRVKVFYQCSPCSGVSRTFTWTFGLATATQSYSSNNTGVTYAEIEIVNISGSHTTNALLGNAIMTGNNPTAAAIYSTTNQDTSGTLALSFSYTQGAAETITPKGFIVERL